MKIQSESILKRVAWLGDDYCHDKLPADRRLLLVSESFYDREGNLANQPNPSGFLIGLIVRGEWTKKRSAYFTKVCNLILAKREGLPSEDEKKAFWNKVVFYHFVRKSVGDTPSKRPDDTLWKEGGLGLRAVIQNAAPSHVIFLGKELGDHVVAQGLAIVDQHLADKDSLFHGYISGTDPLVPALATHHPSSRAYKKLDSIDRVRNFLGTDFASALSG